MKCAAHAAQMVAVGSAAMDVDNVVTVVVTVTALPVMDAVVIGKLKTVDAVRYVVIAV